jgi:uncharacterized protein YqgC (DUF456 family)
MIWTHLLYYLLLLAVLLVGLFISILGLPGLWLMVAGAWLYAWMTGVGHYIGWTSLWILFALAVAAEIVEFAAGAAGARKAGGLGRSVVGAVVGAMLGGVFLSFIPIPVISTIVGVCLGAFIGASAMEYTGHGDIAQSMRVGAGAAQGRFYGIAAKLAFGLLIGLITLITAFPYSTSASISPSPTAPAATTTTLPGP